MKETPEQQIARLKQKMREHRAKVFLQAAIDESVDVFDCAGTKEILESYVELLEEFTP